MSTTVKEVIKPRTAKRLFDPSKRKHTSNRPMNIDIEYIVDDETGIGQWYLWYATEQGDYIGKKNLDKKNELTQEIIPLGEEYTMPYSRRAFDKIRKLSWGRMRWYKKDGELTTGFTTVDELEKFALDLDQKPKE